MDIHDFSTGIANLGQELAYDLRQIYAKLVGDHLEDIAQARKSDNYAIYYKSLKDLHIIVSHKLKDKTEKGQDKTDEEVYNDLVKAAVTNANKHSNEWLGNSKDPKACAEIEHALNSIEMFLYKKIDEANMFGAQGKIPGL